MSQNRFRPPTPEEDTDKTEESDDSLQTAIRKYWESKMAAAAAPKQNQNQNVPNPQEI